MPIVKHLVLERLEYLLNEFSRLLITFSIADEFTLSTSESVIYDNKFGNYVPIDTVSALRLDNADQSRFIQITWREHPNDQHMQMGTYLAWFMDEEVVNQDGVDETDHAWMNPEFNDRYCNQEDNMERMVYRMVLFLMKGHNQLPMELIPKYANELQMEINLARVKDT